MIKRTIGVCLCLLTFLSLASVANAAESPSASGGYAYTTIIPPGFMYAIVQGINNNGEVLGTAWTQIAGFPTAFLYSGGTYTELNPPGSIWSYASEIKDNGTVMGSFRDSSGNDKGFVYSKGMYTELSVPGYTDSTVPLEINENGSVIMTVGYNSNNRTGFLYSGGTYIQLLSPHLYSNEAYGINDNDAVLLLVGPYDTSTSMYRWHSFIYIGGALFELNPPGSNPAYWSGIFVYWKGINNNGEVIGYSYDSSWNHKSFLYSRGTYTEMLPPGWINVDDQSPFNKINNNGEVIGSGTDSFGRYKGFVYSEGTYTELSPPGFYSVAPIAINNNGAVIGSGTDGSYAPPKCFLAIPLPIQPTTNNPPVVDAGKNTEVSSDTIQTISIHGKATDQDQADILSYRWREGKRVLLDWTAVGSNGECPLDLGIVSLSIGSHTLTLEVSDGKDTTSEDMILTIGNSAPHAVATGAGTYQINTPVTLSGNVSDYDGDTLTYEWREGANVLCSGTVQTAPGGTPVTLQQECILVHSGFGKHLIFLQVADGINDPVASNIIKVEVIDNQAPTLAPVANQTILWPANHKMVTITIQANANDNSGLPVTLTASVTSNEPEDGLGDGDTAPDWTEPVIDQDKGTITLQLRAERSGKGKGREYTVAITATDFFGNSSSASVKIIVPHDQGKK